MPTDIIIPGVPINALPLATAISPGALPPGYISPEVIAPVAYAGGNIVTWAGAGVLGYPQNDTMAHASSIVGVWNGSRICGASETCLVNFSGSIVEGNIAYLSGVAGLATMTAPTASVVPRKIGRVVKAVSISTALVRLSIDQSRDDLTLWPLESYTPSVDAQSYVLVLNPALWSELHIYGSQVGNTAGADILEIRADSVQSGIASGEVGTGPTGNMAIQLYAYSVVANIGKLDNGGQSSFSVHLRKVNGVWQYESTSFGSSADHSTSVRCARWNGVLGTVTSGLQLYNSVAASFQANIANVQLFGKVL